MGSTGYADDLVLLAPGRETYEMSRDIENLIIILTPSADIPGLMTRWAARADLFVVRLQILEI